MGYDVKEKVRCFIPMECSYSQYKQNNEKANKKNMARGLQLFLIPCAATFSQMPAFPAYFGKSAILESNRTKKSISKKRKNNKIISQQCKNYSRFYLFFVNIKNSIQN